MKWGQSVYVLCTTTSSHPALPQASSNLSLWGLLVDKQAVVVAVVVMMGR